MQQLASAAVQGVRLPSPVWSTRRNQMLSDYGKLSMRISFLATFPHLFSKLSGRYVLQRFGTWREGVKCPK